MTLMQQSSPRPRRLRAALIGFGLDNADDQNRLTRGDQSLIFGGSAETHAEMQETALRMEQRARPAGAATWATSTPRELAELAAMIDSPELREIALRLKAGLERDGRAFEELTAEELTALVGAGRERAGEVAALGPVVLTPSHGRTRRSPGFQQGFRSHRESPRGSNPHPVPSPLNEGDAARPAGAAH